MEFRESTKANSREKGIDKTEVNPNDNHEFY